MARKFFRFPAYFWEAAQAMTPKEKGEFYTAVIDYAFSGEKPALSGVVANVFELARFYLDNSNKRLEKR